VAVVGRRALRPAAELVRLAQPVQGLRLRPPVAGLLAEAQRAAEPLRRLVEQPGVAQPSPAGGQHLHDRRRPPRAVCRGQAQPVCLDPHLRGAQPDPERLHAVDDLPGGVVEAEPDGRVDGRHQVQALRVEPGERAGGAVEGGLLLGYAHIVAAQPDMGRCQQRPRLGGRPQVPVEGAAHGRRADRLGVLRHRPLRGVQPDQVMEAVAVGPQLFEQADVDQFVDQLPRRRGGQIAGRRRDPGTEVGHRQQPQLPVSGRHVDGQCSVSPVEHRLHGEVPAGPEARQPVTVPAHRRDEGGQRLARPGGDPGGGHAHGERQPRA
jgi:hypothetical protein